MNLTAIQKAKHIKLVLFDVDGVLTDRKIYFADTGHEYLSLIHI